MVIILAGMVRKLYTRQYTQEETDREKEAYLFYQVRKEDGSFLSSQAGRRNGGYTPTFRQGPSEGRWFEDEDGARRCLATGLMLPNVCIMDRELDVLDREYAECLQQIGGFTMSERIVGVSPMNPLSPPNLFMLRRIIGRQAARQFGSAGIEGAGVGPHEVRSYSARTDCTSAKGEGAS